MAPHATCLRQELQHVRGLAGIASGGSRVATIAVRTAQRRRICKAQLAGAVYRGRRAYVGDGKGRTACTASAEASFAATPAGSSIAGVLRVSTAVLALSAISSFAAVLSHRTITPLSSGLGRELASGQRDRGIDAAKCNAGASALAALAAEASTAATSTASTAGTGRGIDRATRGRCLGATTATPALTRCAWLSVSAIRGDESAAGQAPALPARPATQISVPSPAPPWPG